MAQLTPENSKLYRYGQNSWSVFVLLVYALLVAATGSAQEEDDGTVEEIEEVEGVEGVEEVADEGLLHDLTVVGSRRRDRSAGDSPVPVDVLSSDDLSSHGDSDMNEVLAALIPSYTVLREPIGDAATIVRPPSLRGLPSDSTLILVNGKRRHRASVISWLTFGVSAGAQGPDMAVLPAAAVERVEVLRDGASAQYGSDAIAGIINFVLKSKTSGSMLEFKSGAYTEGDGAKTTLSFNQGLSLFGEGFLNFTMEYGREDPTSRSQQRLDAKALIDAGNQNVRQPAAQIWGSPEVKDNSLIFVNAGIPISSTTEIYGFGNLATRQVEGGFYYRNPHTRGGVFEGPIIDGKNTAKVADLTEATSLLIVNDGLTLAEAVKAVALAGGCPIAFIENNVVDPEGLADVKSTPGCYTLLSKFPGGFTPQFGGYVTDWSAAFGMRGLTEEGWDWDVSYAMGGNRNEFYIENTINPQLLSLRDEIPTEYDTGAYVEQDQVANLGVAKAFPNEMFYGDLNVAFGVEARSETFLITAGEINSYYIDPNLALQGFGIGSNGFPGFQPGDAGKSVSRAIGGYLDFETNFSEEFLGGLAIRYESYADFGETLDGKVAGRFQVSPTLAVRGSLSSGFRVPTAGQANVRNVTTEIVAGRLADAATLPPTNPIAQQKGAIDLVPETAINLTLGIIMDELISGMSISADFYKISVSDRLSLTSNFTLTDEDIANLLDAGVSDATSFTSVRFFSNQQDIVATGFDLVVSYPFELAGGRSNLTAVANLSTLELTEFNASFTDEVRKRQIEEGRPGSRMTVTWTHDYGTISALGRMRMYGDHYEAPFNDKSLEFIADGAVVFDMELTYHPTDAMQLVAGVKNLFSTYPSEVPNELTLGQIYPENSPFGFNGGYWYGRFRWTP